MIHPTERQEALEALRRAESDGVLPVGTVITLHLNDEEDQYHSSGACLGARRTREFTLDEAITLPVTNWCDCGGWAATRPGMVLVQAITEYRMIDLERKNWIAGAWPELEKVMSDHRRKSMVGRMRGGGIERLTERGWRAAENVLRNNIGRLGTHELKRMLAAQGLRLELDPQQAETFGQWAKRQTIKQERRTTDTVFDRALREAVATDRKRLVAVSARDNEGWAREEGLPRELSIIIFERTPQNPRVLMNLNAAVAEGLRVLSRPRHDRRLAVASTAEERPEVLETLRTLWFENPENWRDLDEALTAARNLT